MHLRRKTELRANLDRKQHQPIVGSYRFFAEHALASAVPRGTQQNDATKLAVWSFPAARLPPFLVLFCACVT